MSLTSDISLRHISGSPLPQDALTPGKPAVNGIWKPWQKVGFRIVFIFYLLLIIPLEWSWYVRLFTSKSLFEFLGALTGYRADFVRITSESGRWGLASYANWGVALAIAIVGAAVWTLLVRKKSKNNYSQLFYWLRVLVRYRITIGIIAFGFLKTFPMQMPYPSLGNLNTNFGDYTTYKLYWQEVGVVTWYEIFLGWVEVVAGLLMFSRYTSILGAVINAGVLYNIAHANHAYDGGVHVYSAFFVLLSLLIIAYDAPAIYRLLVKRENAVAPEYVPVYNSNWKKYLKSGIKYSIIITFTIVYGYIRYNLHYNHGRLKEPVKPGLANAQGVYNVTEFRLNGQLIPYSPFDTVRWQDAILEKYSTFTFKTARPVAISLANGTPRDTDVERSYELAGTGGGRRYFYYDADTVKQVLYLQDKNSGGPEEPETRNRNARKPKVRTKLEWHYSRPSADRIIITGRDENKDSIQVVLDRVPRSYLLGVDRSRIASTP